MIKKGIRLIEGGSEKFADVSSHIDNARILLRQKGDIDIDMALTALRAAIDDLQQKPDSADNRAVIKSLTIHVEHYKFEAEYLRMVNYFRYLLEQNQHHEAYQYAGQIIVQLDAKSTSDEGLGERKKEISLLRDKLRGKILTIGEKK